MTQLYSELTDWYDLVDPVVDHEREAGVYGAALAALVPGAKTLLELGAGAGNNAWWLKGSWACTLTDLSEPMLARSRAQNPTCEHLTGDMRTLRLGRTFDVVLVHDAVMYMTTEAELEAAALTAFVHTRPGGGALFVPDVVRETFAEGTELLEGDAGSRSVRTLAWTWDPDPADTEFRTDYVFALREAGTVRTVHDQHLEGLFPIATWERVLRAVGFEVATTSRDIGEVARVTCFECRRP